MNDELRTVNLVRGDRVHLWRVLSNRRERFGVLRNLANRGRGRMFDAPQVQVTEDIHKVNVRIVWRIVGIEILMHVPVREILCAHIIEMVRGLEFTPVADKLGVAGTFYLLFETIQLVNGVGLHCVAKPRRKVSFGVRPAYQVRDVNDADTLLRLHWAS